MEDAGGVASIVRDGWIDWEVPGKPVCVRITSDVAARLAMAVREGFKALPRRGLETGGLLIGSRRSGEPAVVEIDDFEPIESEHAAGPAYLLSEVDRRLLETRIKAHDAAGKRAAVVGFYRSHTRPDFAITKEDAGLFSAYFRNSSDVFLLIKPNEGGPPLGGFVIREEGKNRLEQSLFANPACRDRGRAGNARGRPGDCTGIATGTPPGGADCASGCASSAILEGAGTRSGWWHRR